MTLYEAIAAELPYLRGEAEGLMRDACVIRRKTGTAFNETTGKYTDTVSTIYTGVCKVQETGRGGDGEDLAGAREVVKLGHQLHLPVSVSTVQVDDVAEITASLDPALVGRKLRVVTLMFGTFKTARRLPVEEVVA